MRPSRASTCGVGHRASNPDRGRLRPKRSGLALVALLSAAVACGPAEGTDDPGGEHAPAASQGFVVSPEPVLVLEDDGSPEKLFSRISARRLPGGEVVVGDAATGDLVIFGREGQLLRRLARRGRGPGELEGEFALTAQGDTIYALGRPPMSPPDVSVFAADRGFLSRVSPEAANARVVTVLDRLATGELVVQRGLAAAAFWTVPEPGTLVPDTVVYGLLPASGDSVRWLPPVIRGTYVSFPWRLGRSTTSLAPYPLGPATVMVASSDRLWLIKADGGDFVAHDGAGRQVTAGRLPLDPRPFDQAEVRRARDRALATATRGLDSAKARAMYDPALLPRTMPVLSDAHAGPDGEVWVRLFDLDDEAAPRYLVLDRDGREVGRATLPARLEVQQIGTDFVLGIRNDSLGVESVHEYAFRRR